MLYTATSGIGSPAQVDHRIDGLLLVMPPADSPLFQRCEKRNIPYVSVLLTPSAGRYTVNSDDYRGGQLAAEHLISLGHRRIAHLRGRSDVNTSAGRQQGFEDSLRGAGIPVDPRYVVQAGFNWQIGYQSMRSLLDLPQAERPTAIFAANDLCAEGAMRAIREHELRIPEDIAIVGFDDTRFASMTQPPLTSVHMPITEMGATAARMLIERLEGHEPANPNPILPVFLTVRNSCGASAALETPGTLVSR